MNPLAVPPAFGDREAIAASTSESSCSETPIERLRPLLCKDVTFVFLA
jgi:hypothetical protein